MRHHRHRHRHRRSPKDDVPSGLTVALALVPEAVVVVSLVARHGVEYLFPAVVLCGLIRVGAGLARLGRFIRMVPHPVMMTVGDMLLTNARAKAAADAAGATW